MASMVFPVFPGGAYLSESTEDDLLKKAKYYKKKFKKLKKENKLLKEQIDLLKLTNTKSKSL